MARRKYTTLPWTEYPTSLGNFGPESERLPLDSIILHSTNSTYMSAVNWFGNPNAGTSAHYVISNNGELAAMLEEYLVGYHSGNYRVNQSSIGIEHEGYVGMVRSDKEYETSIKLVADICKFYNIPCDSTHIKPHKNIVATQCPTDLDIDRIINGAKALLNPTDPCQTYKNEISFKDKIIGERDATIIELNRQITLLKEQINNLPPPVVCELCEDCEPYKNQIQFVKDTIWGKGWWFTRINTLRGAFPK